MNWLRNNIFFNPICPPILYFNQGNILKIYKHEGRHRATLAMVTGINKIPVLIHGLADKFYLNEEVINQSGVRTKVDYGAWE